MVRRKSIEGEGAAEGVLHRRGDRCPILNRQVDVDVRQPHAPSSAHILRPHRPQDFITLQDRGEAVPAVNKSQRPGARAT